MRSGIVFLAFTEKGCALAQSLAAKSDAMVQDGRAPGFSLQSWTGEQFSQRQALVFIGAAGIAVRAVAPFLQSKAEDPAVLCMDERGEHVIPLLSGHLGGANALARRLAALCGGTAVLTTSTDINGVFAVDLWAKAQGMHVLEPERIKSFSAALLRGEPVGIVSPWPIAGTSPEGVTLVPSRGQAVVTLRPEASEALHLVPKLLWLGIGCRKGVSAGEIEAVFLSFCQERRILPQAFAAAASIDRKKEEAGLLLFCKNRGLPLSFYSPEELSRLEGPFSASRFVKETVGVDNVCERSAVWGSGGTLWERKYAKDGVTFAAALARPSLDWKC